MQDRLKRVAVIGAGPAGLSAALWLHLLGLAPTLFERETDPGGMLRFNFLTNEWVLGLSGLTGTAMAERFVAHILSHNIPIHLGREVRQMVSTPDGWRLSFAGDHPPFAARAVIVATGLRYRGIESLTGVAGALTLPKERIAFGPFAFVGLERYRAKSVLIVGCGDNAFENALHLCALDAEVVLLCRSRPRAQQQFREALAKHRATLVEGAQLLELAVHSDHLVARWRSPQGEHTQRFDRLHVLTGYTPNSDWLIEALGETGSEVCRTADGYLVVDGWGRTSLPLLYGAGDVADRDFPSVVSAVAAGARAAKALERDLRERF